MRLRAHLLVFGLLLTFFGCGRGNDRPANLPPLFPVSITILQEKNPVEGAFVRLVPVDAAMPWSSGATTNTSGVAMIKTVGKYDGAPEGAYKVVVSKLEMSQGSEVNLGNLDEKTPRDQSASYDLVDPKYSIPTTSPLDFQVSKENSKAEFDVGAAVRIKRKGPPR